MELTPQFLGQLRAIMLESEVNSICYISSITGVEIFAKKLSQLFKSTKSKLHERKHASQAIWKNLKIPKIPWSYPPTVSVVLRKVMFWLQREEVFFDVRSIF